MPKTSDNVRLIKCPRCGVDLTRTGEYPVPTMVGAGGVAFKGAVARVSPMQGRILTELIDNMGATVRHPRLLYGMYGDEASVSRGRQMETLRMQISMLRERLSPLGLLIKVARDLGYRLVEREGLVQR